MSSAQNDRPRKDKDDIVWTGSAWEGIGEPRDVSDAMFSLVNDADPTKKATFSLAGHPVMKVVG